MDKVFYQGIVARSLPNQLHVVLYDDGVQETLNLSKERYRILPSTSSPQQSVWGNASLSPQSHSQDPSFKEDFVSYTPPSLPPRKRFRARLLRSKRTSKQPLSHLPKVFLKQRVSRELRANMAHRGYMTCQLPM
ncbi:unnamed protein product [Agarophyton chilense]